MFKIRGSIVVYLARVRLSDIAGSPFRAPYFSAFLENVLEGVSKLVAKSEQEYRFVSAENRQL